jgi:hypothetical protein
MLLLAKDILNKHGSKDFNPSKNMNQNHEIDRENHRDVSEKYDKTSIGNLITIVPLHVTYMSFASSR